MPQISPAMWQFNGLALLFGYLQRLATEDEIRRILGTPTDPVRSTALPPMLEAVRQALSAGECEVGQIARLLPHVEGWFDQWLPRSRAEGDLIDQVAVTGGGIYGERAVNDSLILIGRRFDPAVADRFLQRRLFHEGRVRVVNQAVAALAARSAVPEPERSHIAAWYDQLVRNRPRIKSDLAAVRSMLLGPSPAVPAR